MKQFESNQNVLAGKDAKRIIKVNHEVAQILETYFRTFPQAFFYY